MSGARRAAAPKATGHARPRKQPAAAKAAPRGARPFAIKRPMPAAAWAVVGVVAVLDFVGLLWVLSASSVTALADYGSTWYFFERQLLWFAIGVAAFGLTANLDLAFLRRCAGPLLAVAGILLVAVLVPGIGIKVAFARRWIGAGPLVVQPSEIAKLALVVWGADLLARRAGEVDDTRRTVRPILFVLGVFALLVMLEPDFDTVLELGAIVFTMLVIAGVPWRALGRTVALAAGAAVVGAYSSAYRRARMLEYLHPGRQSEASKYQITQSLIAIGSGGFRGVGLGAGRSKWLFLPAAHTDFIFAVIGEESGLFGALLVLALFAAFAFVGARVAARASNRFGMLLAVGITAWVSFQAIVNLGMVVGVLPVSGTPLPFISAGGSSLVVLMAASGLLTSVARDDAHRATRTARSRSRAIHPTGRRAPAPA